MAVYETVESFDEEGNLLATPTVTVSDPAIYEQVMSYVKSGKLAVTPVAVVNGGGGTGAVDSVNGKTGVVVLNAADVGAVDLTTYTTDQETINNSITANTEAIAILQNEARSYLNISDTTDILQAMTEIGITQGTILTGQNLKDMLVFYNCKKLVLKYDPFGADFPVFNNETKLENFSGIITIETAGDGIKIDLDKVTAIFDIVKNWTLGITNDFMSYPIDILFYTSWYNIMPKPILLKGSITGLNTIVLAGQRFNFLSLLSDTNPFDIYKDDNNLVGDPGFEVVGVGADKLLKFPPYKLTNYSIQVTINGSISGAANTAREFKIQLARTTPTPLERGIGVVRVTGNALTDRSNGSLNTFQLGSNDAFVTDGARIELNNISPSDITLNSYSIMIQGNQQR